MLRWTIQDNSIKDNIMFESQFSSSVATDECQDYAGLCLSN